MLTLEGCSCLNQFTKTTELHEGVLPLNKCVSFTMRSRLYLGHHFAFVYHFGLYCVIEVKLKGISKSCSQDIAIVNMSRNMH